MPAVKTVKLSAEAHASLKELAEAEGVTLMEEIGRIIEEKRRQRMFDEAEKAYEELREDEAAWNDYRDEVEEIEGTIGDGLEEYE